MTGARVVRGDVVHCGECSEVMAREIPDESIDLTVTSPPYDNLRDYKGYTFDFDAIAAQLWRVTKQGGVVVWVVGDATVNGSETCTSDIQKLHFKVLGFNVETMIYMKTGTSAAGSMTYYLQVFEYMFVFSKGRPKTVNIIRDRQNLRPGRINSRAGRRKAKGERKDERAMAADFGRRFNVWTYNPGNQGSDGQHPATFPEALARDHIISWSNPGDVVLDPMCGSGTTLKMAKELDRRHIGIDISREYCALSERRVRAARVALPGLNEAAQEAEKEQQAALFEG